MNYIHHPQACGVDDTGAVLPLWLAPSGTVHYSLFPGDGWKPLYLRPAPLTDETGKTQGPAEAGPELTDEAVSGARTTIPAGDEI